MVSLSNAKNRQNFGFIAKLLTKFSLFDESKVTFLAANFLEPNDCVFRKSFLYVANRVCCTSHNVISVYSLYIATATATATAAAATVQLCAPAVLTRH